MKIECETEKVVINKPIVSLNLKRKTMQIKKKNNKGQELIITLNKSELDKIKMFLRLM